MSRRNGQQGFSMIELLVVLSILGVLVRMSLPALANMRREAIAADAVGDFNVIRAAAVSQFEATGSYPADGAAGQVPPGMAPFLPSGFAFTRKDYQLDWDHWTIADSTGGAQTDYVLAVTIVAPDEMLHRQLLSTLGSNCTHWTVDDASTFVVMSSLEARH